MKVEFEVNDVVASMWGTLSLRVGGQEGRPATPSDVAKRQFVEFVREHANLHDPEEDDAED